MKCRLTKTCKMISEKMEMAKDLPLLFMRLVLAYSFWGPATMKWNNMDAITESFTVPEDLVWIVSSNVQPKKTKYSLLI